MQIVILAGGLGKRLGTLTASLPKAMVRIAGQPVLDYQLQLAARHGYRNVLILTGHRAEVIEQHYGDGRRWGLEIRYSREPTPLGTAGAVRLAWERGLLQDAFMLFYGDIVMDVDLDALLAFHNRGGGACTLVVQPTDHPDDSDLVAAGEDGRVHRIFGKPHCEGVELRNVANAALSVISSEVIRYIPAGVPSDLDRDLFPALVRDGVAISAYRTAEYVKDIGTKTRFDRAERDLATGRVGRLCRRNPRPALFLDRDGVLNVRRGVISEPELLSLRPSVAAAVRRLNLSDYLSIVVTNQPDLGAGLFEEAALERVHARLDRLLVEEAEAFADDLFYCPHHPSIAGFCTCRMPAPGLLEAAIVKHNIDRTRSFLVCEGLPELKAGRAAGIGTIVLAPESSGTFGEDYRFDGLEAAVAFLLDEYPALAEGADSVADSATAVLPPHVGEVRFWVTDGHCLRAAAVLAERMRRRGLVCELSPGSPPDDAARTSTIIRVGTDAGVALFSLDTRTLGLIRVDSAAAATC